MPRVQNWARGSFKRRCAATQEKGQEGSGLKPVPSLQGEPSGDAQPLERQRGLPAAHSCPAAVAAIPELELLLPAGSGSAAALSSPGSNAINASPLAPACTAPEAAAELGCSCGNAVSIQSSSFIPTRGKIAVFPPARTQQCGLLPAWEQVIRVGVTQRGSLLVWG